jgi:hypothetical protein
MNVNKNLRKRCVDKKTFNQFNKSPDRGFEDVFF